MGEVMRSGELTVETSGRRQSPSQWMRDLKPDAKQELAGTDAGEVRDLTNVDARPGASGPSSLAPAPLRDSSADIHRVIAGHLTFAEIVRFVRVCRRLRDSFRLGKHKESPAVHPVRLLACMRLHEVGAALNPMKGHSLSYDGSARVEAVVFHFAEDRVAGVARPLPIEPVSRLRAALTDGNVPVLRAGLREFLALSASLLATRTKVALLCEPDERCLLEEVATSACGHLSEPERRKYDAVRAYVDEIVSSPHLALADKMRLCIQLQPIYPKPLGPPRSGAVAVFDLAMRQGNPACAASILRGIAESNAPPDDKRHLLDTLGKPMGGCAAAIEATITSLNAHVERHAAGAASANANALDWLSATVARLEAMRKDAAQAAA